jgi:prephenate dehydratase
LRIHFNLMAPKGATLSTIKSVESHIHALGQCRRFIRQHNYRAVTAADTAGAARQISQTSDVTRGALAPKLAAKIYGLDVLAENVEDEDHNTTRFVILSRENRQVAPGNGPVVTTFVFRVRNLPAALYKALGGFATNGVNMTKLESYMIEGNFFATMFYADVEGHPKDPPLARALEELDFFTQPGSLRILGVYPANPFRSTFKEEKD